MKKSIKELLISAKLRLPLRLAVTALMNAAYIFFNIYFAIRYYDILPLAIALYYFIMAFIRFSLFRSHKRGEPQPMMQKTEYYVGILLLFLALAMSSVIILTLHFNAKRHYEPYSIIPQAAFFIFCLAGLVLRIARHRFRHDPILVSADRVSLTSTLFSLFNLFNYLSHTLLAPVSTAVSQAVGFVASLIAFLSALSLIRTNKN